jgi:hypothetical protein
VDSKVLFVYTRWLLTWFDPPLGIYKKELRFIFAPGLFGRAIGLLSRQANANHSPTHDSYPAVGIEIWVNVFE